MMEFLSNVALFPVVLTLGAYQVGLWCHKKWKNPLTNAILIAVVLVVGFLLLTGFPVDVYKQGTSRLSWLLTPATVSLAVPMYHNIRALRKNLVAVLAGAVSGAVAALSFILLMCVLFSLDDTITISILPKSITTAIGIVLSEEGGGIPALTTLAIFITGITGALLGRPMCRLFGFNDPVSQGVALGTASHAVGTYTAIEMGQLQGAVSSLSLAVAGLFTALVFPIVLMFV